MDFFFASYGYPESEIAVFNSASARDAWVAYQDYFALNFGYGEDEHRCALSREDVIQIISSENALQNELNYRLQDAFDDQISWIARIHNFYPSE